MTEDKDQGKVTRNPDNEETTILTPVPDHTSALDRIPVRTHRRLVVLASVLGVLCLGLGGLSWYLWDTSEKWEVQTNDAVATSYELGEQLAVERAQVVSQQQQIDLLTDQLSTSNDQVLRLADEKASFDDDQALSAQQIAQLTNFVATGSAVANALNRCVDGQQQLAEYLANAEDYEPGELADFQDSLNQLCASAERANAEYQQSLTE